MKRLAACLLALVLLLSGCTEGSYVSVKPHQGENTSGNAQAVAVGNYEEMLAALKEMVAGAVEQQVLSVADMDENAVTATLESRVFLLRSRVSRKSGHRRIPARSGRFE